MMRAVFTGAILWCLRMDGGDASAQCAPTTTSLTERRAPQQRTGTTGAHAPIPGTPALRFVSDVPLAGTAIRFDYQSVDVTARRLYISHMNAGRVVVFDLESNRVVTEIAGLPRVTGVWAVPSHHAVYASAAGAHEVAIIDDRTFDITARVPDVRFPDGIAFASAADKVFVSDESGESDVVIDARTMKKRTAIALGGEAGNTHYDSVSQCILVAVQTTNQMIAIDPVTERVMQRYATPGVDGPHGFTLDEVGRLLFVTGENNATLAVMDLTTMQIVQTLKVGVDPDVVAWDAGWRRLYVAAESGVVSIFQADGAKLIPIGTYNAPHAHTIAVDPRTHRIYLPLENINGKPVLRILEAIQ